MRFVGRNLARPECVLATASGRLFVSDKRGGVHLIAPDGTQSLIGTSNLVPNGIALLRDGSFLVANIGQEGGVWRIARDGTVLPYLLEVDGKRLPGVNYVGVDSEDRVWACISSTDSSDHYPIDDRSGFIVLKDVGGARIITDGLQFTNECRIDAAGRHLYVNETFGRRLTRYRLGGDGELAGRETVAEFGAGDFPDGLALDADGGVWVVSVGNNRVYRVSPEGRIDIVVDDSDSACVERLEAAFQARTLTRPMLSSATGRTLQNITSLAFGGADMRTAYLGCLKGEAIAVFCAPFAGLPPVHWTWG